MRSIVPRQPDGGQEAQGTDGAFLPTMPARHRLTIARGMAVVAVGAASASLVLAAMNEWRLGFEPWGVQAMAAVVMGSLGMLVVSRRPSNVIGWIMLWMAALDGVAAFGLQYGVRSMLASQPLPLADVAATIPYGFASGAVFGLLITFYAIFLLLFLGIQAVGAGVAAARSPVRISRPRSPSTSKSMTSSISPRSSRSCGTSASASSFLRARRRGRRRGLPLLPPSCRRRSGRLRRGE